MAQKPEIRVNHAKWMGSDLRTEATRGEAVEQAETPVTQPIRSNFTIQRIPVAACFTADFHRSDGLQ